MRLKTKIFALLIAILLFSAPSQTIAESCSCVDCACSNLEKSITPWDGSSDTSWYSDEKTEFVISTAEELAGLSELSYNGITFAGKTVKLGSDIDMANISFNPIDCFQGTLDGNGHMITNLTVDMHVHHTRYIGLIRDLQDGTVKNLHMDHVQLLPDGSYYDGYVCEMGIIAGMSNGNCTFENIKVTNSFAETYNNSVGGVCSESYGTVVFRNVQVDASNTLSALWQTPDGRVGGILGYTGANMTVTFDNCVSAPIINAYNDVQANYQYYLYRHCGMLIGHITSPDTTTVTAKDTLVGFGDWNQYKYCEFQELGRGSYNPEGQWKYTRTDNGNDLLAPGHTHRSFEDHELLLPFTNLTGRSTGGRPDYELPGVTVQQNAYYIVKVDNGTGSDYYSDGATASITANEYDCCQFDKWVVLEGNSDDVADLTSASTAIRVSGYINIKATYKHVTPTPTPTLTPTSTPEPTVQPVPSNPSKPEAPVESNVPKTGDNAIPGFWNTMIVLAAAGCILLLAKARQQSNTNA